MWPWERGSPVERAATAAALSSLAERVGKPMRLIDLTTPGATSADIRTDQLGRAVALRPARVTLTFGSADVCGATSLRSFARDLQIIVDLLQRNSGHVIISTIAAPAGPCSLSGAALRHRLEAFNLTIMQTGQRHGSTLVEAQDSPAAGSRGGVVTVGDVRGAGAVAARPEHAVETAKPAVPAR